MSDLEQLTAGPKRRRMSAEVLGVMHVANVLIWGGKPLCAAGLRAGLSDLGLRTTDRGNQHLGDYLGRWGLCLESSKQMVEGRMTVVYLPPPGGITRADLERSFTIADGFDWSLYEEFGSPHVVPDPLFGGTACPQADALMETPAPCMNSQVPAGGAPSTRECGTQGTAVDGPDPDTDFVASDKTDIARPTRRKPRRKRADEDLDDLESWLSPPSEEDLRIAREHAEFERIVAELPD